MPKRTPKHAHTPVIELEIAPGLEDIALDELLERFGNRIQTEPEVETGAIRFGYQGNLGAMLALRSINAAYLLRTYDIPRPKAFLGHEHKMRLLDQIDIAIDVTGVENFNSIHISAAGSGSSVMQRLLRELGEGARLEPHPYEGDMLVRLRRAVHGDGWDALVRLTARPNATRDWRVVDVPGALDGAVAFSMNLLSRPMPEDTVLNALCGSGSLAIERLNLMEAEQVYACDRDPEMLDAATKNIDAAGLSDQIELRDWDATDVPLSPGSVDVMLADLPFGNRVGSHEENIDLYPRLLAEAARLVRRDGRFVIITHEVTLMDAIVRDTDKWFIQKTLRITLSGLRPKIYVLGRV